ncbi:hypothetical protein EJ04DRAFT_493853 [Polyplosphaeria fusca]|uniref:Uncharacterized protein n=1 Tax=Polyplosphaeria fusca TaxID=682080 RepID=A0A9P4R066_9PLEO|nr:hypothetical protein EJ04DRAFT_493853 [Polyplosphaeria fusca]
MASRARTPVLSSDAFDNSYPESSPDPLAASFTENKPKSRPTTRSTKGPLASSSPNKVARTFEMSDLEHALDFSSPSKSMVMNTGRPGGLSPWKIKVTVQAEPGSGSDEENLASPTMRRVTRTKTTTVPLKDADASSPVKRRGRPRKSDTAPKPKRSSTPVRKRSQSKRGRRSSIGVADSSTNVEETPADVVPKKKRGRPRKSVQPAPETEDAAVVQTPVDLPDSIHEDPTPNELQAAASAPRTSFRQTRSIVVPQPSTTAPTFDEHEEPLISTPIDTDLSRKIRARKRTPAAKAVPLRDSSDDEANPPTPTTEEDEIHASIHSVQQSEIREITPQAEAGAALSEVSDDDDFEGVTEFAFDEGVTRGPDDTTILDSENFSMVSVESLPSNGRLSSPVLSHAEHAPRVPRTEPATNKTLLQIPTAVSRGTRSSPLPPREALSITGSVDNEANLPSPRSSPPRETTPSIGYRSPSNPPPIEPAQPCLSRATTPKLSRVVKAGVALQGVLEPPQATPQAQAEEEAKDERRDRLDDLFRGFSEGTRRELQAGLRLGEQLAKQGHNRKSRESSPSLSSPCKAPSKRSADDVFYPRLGFGKSRLPTPEEKDYVLSPPPPVENGDVHYPSLEVADNSNALISPARSVDEMSWRVDTPPVRAIHNTTQTVPAPAQVQHEGYSDIWQEEASRSSDLPEPEGSPQLHDIFADNGQQATKPTRSKIPRTWRRTSGSDFSYSDEIESAKDTPSSTESDEAAAETNKSKAKLMEPVIPEELSDEDGDGDESVASDDTGMFFQSNLPNVFRRRSHGNESRLSEKFDPSLLLEGESMLPDLSPTKTPAKSHADLFQSTPPLAESSPLPQTPNWMRPHPLRHTPQLARLYAAPTRSSPLRQELRHSGSDDSYGQEMEESTLPQSSPFRTQVDDTLASDAQQLQQEMEYAYEGQTASSIRRVRAEADAHAMAYEAQDRTLGEIEEVTEVSKSYRSTVVLPSSPPQRVADSILAPKRAYPSLFGDNYPVLEPTSTSPAPKRKPVVAAQAPREEKILAQAPPKPQGLISRLTTSLWGALAAPAPPPVHPAIVDADPLPKIEPWTKTHYKALERLFLLHKKQPTLFAPAASQGASNANNALLSRFLRDGKKPFVGVRFSNWGYSVTMTESLIVLCAVYMQLLTLKDIAEYEACVGRRIVMGVSGIHPRETGLPIEEFDVVRRLASIVMCEDLRRDERRGLVIDRTGELLIEWPGEE